MSLAAEGAGASEGLDVYLQRMLEQAKLAQLTKAQDTQQTETARHNVADEGLRAKELDISNRTRQGAQTDRENALIDKTVGERGIGDSVDPSEVARETAAGVPKSLYDKTMGAKTLTGFMSTPDVKPEMGGATGSVIKGMSSTSSKPDNIAWKGTQAQRLAQQTEDDRVQEKKDALAKPGPINDANYMLPGVGPIVAQKDKTGKILYQGKDVTNVVKPYVPPDRVLVPTDQGFVPRSDAASAAGKGAPLQPVDPAQVRNRRDMAGKIGTHFDDAFQELDEANKSGALGPLAGRTIGDFLAKGVGSTGDQKLDDLLGALHMDMSALSSGFASLHGRGGANAAIAKNFDNLMATSHMSYSQIKGALTQMQKWTAGYAAKPAAAGADGGAADLVWDPATKTFSKP